MTRELELAVNSGRIYAGMMKLAKEKQDFQKRVDEIYSNTRLSDEGKKREKADWKSRYDKVCRDTKADMLDAINELQTAVNTSQFTPTQEMRDTIDFIETMKKGGCLSDRVLDSQLSKFAGQEMNLVYMREKLKDTIGTEVFDKYTFSGYSKGDIDSPAQFISPDAYFNQLRNALEKGDTITTNYLMDGLESRLGVESSEGKNYKAERQAKLDEPTEVLI